MDRDPIAQALELMTAFARRSDERGRRSLGTDALAVSTFLALATATGDRRHAEHARELVDRVHAKLGQGRRGESPVTGGVRSGGALPERRASEPCEPDLENERDGQDFLHLVEWSLALDHVAQRTGDEVLHRWARELLRGVHGAFTYGPLGARRLHQKMSVDLSRSLVSTTEPTASLAGYVACQELDATATRLGFTKEPPLDAARRDFGSMISVPDLATADPLGIGALLLAHARLARTAPGDPLSLVIHEGAARGLRSFVDSHELRLPAAGRRAFRELALARGLATVRPHDDDLAHFLPLRHEIEAFWLDPAHRRVTAWREHEDINDVMLATSLCAEALLALEPKGAPAVVTPGAVGALNRCVEACIDGEKGYALAAADVRDPQLKAVLHGYATQRADFAQRLQHALTRLGAYAENEGSARGLLHRGVMEARRVLSGPNDARILDECERGDEAALDAYDRVFVTVSPETLPPDLRALLLEQRAAIQTAHDDVARRHPR